jgi:hypothetical protein
VAVSGARPKEVTFNCSASSLEEAGLVFTLDAKSSQDALVVKIPVLSAQQSVFVATSMGVIASQDPLPWREGLLLCLY